MGISTKQREQTSTLNRSDSEIDAFNVLGIEAVIANADTQIYHLQAAHISRTNMTIYGNTLNLHDRLTNGLLVAF